MSLRFKLQLVVVAYDGQETTQDLAVLDKEHEQVEHLGLTLTEAKHVLRELQREVLTRQVSAFLATQIPCPMCGQPRGPKDHKTVCFGTLFGKLDLHSPRLRPCPCRRQPHDQASFSPLAALLPERTAPELRYLETRWASLVSYGLTVKALRDFLPVDDAAGRAPAAPDTHPHAQWRPGRRVPRVVPRLCPRGPGGHR